MTTHQPKETTMTETTVDRLVRMLDEDRQKHERAVQRERQDKTGSLILARAEYEKIIADTRDELREYKNRAAMRAPKYGFCTEEPPVGSAVRDCYDDIWQRSSDGISSWCVAIGDSRMGWSDLLDTRGPLHIIHTPNATKEDR